MLEKMRKILAEQLDCDEEQINLETRFKEDLEADSLDLFEMVMSLEEEYAMEFPAEDLENLKTVGDVITYLKSKGIEG
ncbi:MAG: acyl carrier protein [Eubacterium sp.]|nr:acyl carrier protein [Eubacterium sp.]